MICINGFKFHCYLIFMDVIIVYKEQVFSTGIKANLQCFICHVPTQQQENLIKLWPSQTYKSLWSQLKPQNNNFIK